MARVLDSALGIPGTRVRFGLDSVAGLIPGFGDVAAALASGYIILSAYRLGAPASVLVRMLLNLGTDTLVGAVPIVGDLFDVSFKANTRNTALLERHLGEPAETKKASRLTLVAVIAGVAFLGVAVFFLGVLAMRGVAGLLS